MEENKPNEIPVLAQTPAQPPPAPSPLKEIKPKGSGLKSKWLFLIILLLLVLILPLGGYFILNQTKNTPSPTPTPDQKACSQEAMVCPDGSTVGRTGPNCEFEKCLETPASSSADTSDWKTYTNTKLGISFQYPSDDVGIEDYDDGSMTANYISFDPKNPSNFRIFGLHSRYNVNSEKKIIDDYQNHVNKIIEGIKKDGGEIVIPMTNIYISDHPAYKFGAKNHETGDSKYIYIPNDHNFIVISYPFYSKNVDEDNPLMDQILSTFKFTQ